MLAAARSGFSREALRSAATTAATLNDGGPRGAAGHTEVDVSPRDITGRVLGRPLRSPYVPGGGTPRARWIWLLAIAWLLWAGVISDHSWWRIARLRHDLASTQSDLARVHREASALDARVNDPAERERHAEEALRARHGAARRDHLPPGHRAPGG